MMSGEIFACGVTYTCGNGEKISCTGDSHCHGGNGQVTCVDSGGGSTTAYCGGPQQ